MTYDTGTTIGRNNCHCAIQPSYAIASIYYIAYIPYPIYTVTGLCYFFTVQLSMWYRVDPAQVDSTLL